MHYCEEYYKLNKCPKLCDETEGSLDWEISVEYVGSMNQATGDGFSDLKHYNTPGTVAMVPSHKTVRMEEVKQWQKASKKSELD